MPNMPYDFKRKRPASGIFRRILIGGGVSAVLAAGIWFLRPAEAGRDAETPVPEAPAAVPAEPAGTPAESTPAETVPAAPAAVPAKEESVETAVENPSAPAPAAETPVTAIPLQKGVPHPTDPADEDPYTAPDLLGPGGFAENLNAVRKFRKSGQTDLAEARIQTLMASTAFGSSEYREAAKELNAMHLKNPLKNTGTMQTYTVRSGDSLIKLARRHHVAAAQLAAANRLTPDARLRIGQKLQIPSGSTWSVRVSKRARLLCVARGDNLYGVFDIGIGRRNLTPEGRFTVREVLDNPPYPKPHVGMVPGGSPRNPLGPCWIGLADAQGRPTGYGIHGTADESSVTRNLSSGCIRMRNAEVKILRGLLPIGTPVVIEP